MKTRIEVQDREEAAQIQTALSDPEIRAFVRIAGTLLQLPTDRSRRRVLNFAADSVAEAVQE